MLMAADLAVVVPKKPEKQFTGKLSLRQCWNVFSAYQWRNFGLISGGDKARGALRAPRIETPKALMGWGMGRGIPFSSRLWGLGERREVPQRSPGRAPAEKRF